MHSRQRQRLRRRWNTGLCQPGRCAGGGNSTLLIAPIAWSRLTAHCKRQEDQNGSHVPPVVPQLIPRWRSSALRLVQGLERGARSAPAARLPACLASSHTAAHSAQHARSRTTFSPTPPPSIQAASAHCQLPKAVLPQLEGPPASLFQGGNACHTCTAQQPTPTDVSRVPELLIAQTWRRFRLCTSSVH